MTALTTSHRFAPRLRRQLARVLDRQVYANRCELQDLPHRVFAHRVPLYRPFPGMGREVAAAKTRNLRRALATLDGLVIEPGQAFSFWHLVGAPTLARGFVLGPDLHQGQLRRHPGGGLCQASNLIFWMAAHSPLLILERWRHAYDAFADTARTQPFGSGASLLYNYRDLRLKNHSVQRWQLRLWLSPNHLHGSLNAEAPLTEPITVVETDTAIYAHDAGRFTRHNKLWRVQGGQRQLLVENNALLTYTPRPHDVAGPKPRAQESTP